MKEIKGFLKLVFVFLILFSLVGCDDDIIDVVIEPEKYEVKFIVDGETIDSQEVEEGTSAIAPSVLEKVGYKFIGWDKEFDNVKSDLEVNAIFEILKYQVKFIVDEEVIDSQEVEYGESAIIDIVPSKEGYKFIGWDKEFDNIKSDLEVNAIFEEMTIEKEKINGVINELENYFNSLTYPLVNGMLELLEEKDGILIEWTSSDEKVISLNGRIRQPYTDKKQEEIILSAKLSLNGCFLNAKFNLNVKRGYKDLSKGINAVYNYNSSYLSESALKTFDIVYYAFLGLRLDASGNFSNALATKSKINGYKDKLHKEGGRALVSLVANSGDAPNNIRKIAENDESLERLANNLLNFCKENDLDGVDIDWETPGLEGGLAYTKLIKKYMKYLRLKMKST